MDYILLLFNVAVSRCTEVQYATIHFSLLTPLRDAKTIYRVQKKEKKSCVFLFGGKEFLASGSRVKTSIRALLLISCFVRRLCAQSGRRKKENGGGNG